MRYAYPCVLAPERSGGFSVSFPSVPEALACGEDEAEAMVKAEHALALALGAHVRSREDIPAPGPLLPGQVAVAVPLVVAAKLALYTAMREQGLSNVGLAARLGVSEGAVRKLLNPGHRSHIGQVERALKHVGKRMVVEDGGRPTAVLVPVDWPESQPPLRQPGVCAPSGNASVGSPCLKSSRCGTRGAGERARSRLLHYCGVGTR